MRLFAFWSHLCKSGAKLRNFVITATFTDYIFAIFAQNPVFFNCKYSAIENTTGT